MEKIPWKERELIIGSDHGGFELKQTLIAHLIQHGISVEDVGCHKPEPVDYPDVATRLVNKVQQGKRGILVCGTGIGMSMAANKFQGIRAALCHNEFTVQMSREHNNANILCLGGRVLEQDLAMKMLDIWLSIEFLGLTEERHKRRVDKIHTCEGRIDA